jgi:hypothetical protein
LVAFIAVARNFSPRECAKTEVSDQPRAGRNAGAKKNILTAANNFQIVQKVKINFHPSFENNKPGDRPQ